MPKYCSQCQTESSDEAAFCPQCGGSLAVAASPQTFNPGAQAPPPPAGSPAPPPGAYVPPAGSPAPPPGAYVPPAGSPAPPPGAYVPPAGSPAPPPGAAYPAPTGGTPSYSFNVARWSTADRITGIASLVLFISLFLPWFSVNFGFGIVTASGLDSHGYLYLVLFVSIAILVYLFARAGWDKLPISASVAHAPVMLVATLLNLVIVALAFLLKPGGSGVGWSIGAFVALAAAIVAVAPIAIPAIQSRSAS